MLDEGESGGDVVGDDTSAKTVVGVVSAVNNFLEGVELEDALHRAEDLSKRVTCYAFVLTVHLVSFGKPLLSRRRMFYSLFCTKNGVSSIFGKNKSIQ